jgi:hypothetical protein
MREAIEKAVNRDHMRSSGVIKLPDEGGNQELSTEII